MKKYLTLLPILILTGCMERGVAKDLPPPAVVPGSIVFQTQGYYNVAVAAENAYGRLPRCGKPASPKICSDVTIMRIVRKADDTAHVAIMQAQDAVRTPGFGKDKLTTVIASAKALTGAFLEITESLPKKE